MHTTTENLPTEALPELMTIAEVAELLRTPIPTVYYLVGQGKLPAIRIGGRWRLKRSVLNRDILDNDEAFTASSIAIVTSEDWGQPLLKMARKARLQAMLLTEVADLEAIKRPPAKIVLSLRTLLATDQPKLMEHSDAQFIVLNNGASIEDVTIDPVTLARCEDESDLARLVDFLAK